MALAMVILTALLSAAHSYALAEDKGVITFHTANPDGILTQEEVEAQAAAAGVTSADTFSATFDASVKGIGDHALRFQWGITRVHIPDSVMTIGYDVFHPWCALEEFTVSPGNKYFSTVDGILFDKDKTKLIKYPALKHGFGVHFDYDIPDSVVSIGDYAFADCWYMINLVIPDGVVSIGDYAFIYCAGIKSFFLPQSVKDIGYMSFSAPDYTEINVSPDNKYFSSLDGVLFDKDMSTLLQYPPAEESRTRYAIPNGVKNIGADAFRGAQHLMRVDMPDSLVNVGERAFRGCYVLTDVVIGKNVVGIGEEAFFGCSWLTNVVVFDKVTHIGKDAFNIGNAATPVLTIYSAEKTYAYSYLRENGIRWRSILEWPPSVKTIVFRATGAEGKLTKEDVIAQLADVDAGPGSGFFAEFDTSVLAIGDNAFSMCLGLKGIVIPDAITSIGDSAFRDCMSLETISIGNGLTSISEHTFLECRNITSVFIPASVTSIGIGAFSSCNRLYEVYLSGDAPEVDGYGFYGVAAGAIAHVNKDAKGFPLEGRLWNGLTVKYREEEAEVPLKPWNNPFKDVKDTDWFFEPVKYTNRKGLVQGTTTDTFSPNTSLTRGMAVAVLYRLEGRPNVDWINNPFSDVPAGQWYTDAVIWAAASGIAVGYGDNRYGPADNITREQLATIFLNYYEYLGDGPEGAWMIRVEFEDLADISEWALNAVAYCNMKGIITGRPNNVFDPKGNATRAEFVTILMRFMEAV